MATSEWLRFFEDAGIPPGPALGYAVAFVDNRIHKNMLLDLTRELMKELGITVVGDVIAILRHAKVVHRQEMCRAASESLRPEAPGDRDRDRERDRDRDRPRPPPGSPRGAAGRMITNSLRREPAPRPPRRPPGAGISVTVPNGAAEAAEAGGSGAGSAPAKRRRVRADPEGTDGPRVAPGSGRRVLELLPAARGLGRTSVFERLGAEANAAAAAGGKPSGVFGRLGDAPEAAPGAAPGAAEALPYAGVLKKRRECGGAAEAQDGAVSSSGPAAAESRPPWGCGKVSSSCDPRGAGSVFRRLGRKPD